MLLIDVNNSFVIVDNLYWLYNIRYLGWMECMIYLYIIQYIIVSDNYLLLIIFLLIGIVAVVAVLEYLRTNGRHIKPFVHSNPALDKVKLYWLLLLYWSNCTSVPWGDWIRHKNNTTNMNTRIDKDYSRWRRL